MPDPVVVVPYNPRWSDLFEALAARVRRALGDELTVTVEHVGSTSVPGLAAKPVIDLDVIIPTAADLPVVTERLATIGYVHEGDKGLPGRDAFLWPPGEVRHHLYVCPKGSVPLQEHLLFRDYLRAHPEEAQRCSDLKRELAVRYQDDRLAYSEAKTEYVLGVLKKAGYERKV